MFLRVCRRFFLVSLFSLLGHNTRVSPFAFAMTLRGKRELKDRATKFAIYGLPFTLRMLRVKSDKCDWFWSQFIVFTKPFKTGLSFMVSQLLQNSTTCTFIFNKLYLCSTRYIYIQHFIFIFNNTHFLSTLTQIIFIQQKYLFNFNQK